jgi:ATP synthase protein I
VVNKRDNGVGDGRSSEEADLDARRRALSSKLEALEQKQTEAQAAASRSGSDTSGMGRGFRYSADFVSAVLVGGGLGWFFDHLLGTRPWGLIVFVVLGFVAGVFNLLRLAERERRRGEQ